MKRLTVIGSVLVLNLALGSASFAASVGPQSFATPQQAVQAVQQACDHNDTAALLAIFGPDGKDIVESGDTDQDKDGRMMFSQMAKKKTQFIADPMNPDKMIVSLG